MHELLASGARRGSSRRGRRAHARPDPRRHDQPAGQRDARRRGARRLSVAQRRASPSSSRATPRAPTSSRACAGRGTGPSLALMGHTDVVYADPADWSVAAVRRRGARRPPVGPRSARHEVPDGGQRGRARRAGAQRLRAERRRPADRRGRRGGRRRRGRPELARGRAARPALRLRPQRGQLPLRARGRPHALHALREREDDDAGARARARRRRARVAADRTATTRCSSSPRCSSASRPTRPCAAGSPELDALLDVLAPGDGTLEERIERGRAQHAELWHVLPAIAGSTFVADDGARVAQAQRDPGRGARSSATAACSRAPTPRSCWASSARRSAGSTSSWSWPRRRSAGTRSPFETPLRDALAELDRRARAGCAARAGDQHGLHRLALPAGGLRDDRLRFLPIAAHGSRAARHDSRARRAHRRARPRTCGARVRALHRPDRIGDGVSDQKLRLGGMALRNGLALFGPTSWAAAVRTPDGGIRVASGPRPRIHAADGVPLVRGVVRMAEMFMALPVIRRSLPEARLSFEHGSVAASAVVCTALAAVVRRRGGFRGELASTVIGIVPSLVTLRSRDLVRYHGAEHKTVAGYERGVEAVDHGQGARALRVAPRRPAAAGRGRRRGHRGARAPQVAPARRRRRLAGGHRLRVRAVRLARAAPRHARRARARPAPAPRCSARSRPPSRARPSSRWRSARWPRCSRRRPRERPRERTARHPPPAPLGDLRPPGREDARGLLLGRVLRLHEAGAGARRATTRAS